MIPLPGDKQKHAVIGFLMGLSAFFIPINIVVLGGISIAFLKEFYDSYNSGTPEMCDFFVTVGGMMLGITPVILFHG